ncbi:MAG: ATP-binding protein [Candidatus Faecousia sp.]|nr:ATP-binding protein [Clostridiales bacterium]MDY6181291.1 ATP-binding protein [Candidatus Faecousia sp.]
MAYSAEVVKRARERLAQAREDRESENRQHLAEAYARVPRIREIDMQLRRTMAQAAQAAFLQGSDGRELLEQAREENLSLQREREELVRQYFEEGYLDDSPICRLCGGTGYVGSTMCECLTELCRQEQKKEISILAGKESFSQFRLDYYPDRIDPMYGASPRTIMERNFQTCRKYAMYFGQNAGNLLFVGGTGLGKTFLSACIARTVADRGYSVAYETAAHLFGNLEQARFNPTEESRREAGKYTSCDLLILDDLGTEMPGQFVTAALYSLLNDRILAGKPMVISTNLNVEEMNRRYSPQIASRLHGGFTRLTFVGEDIRVLKNRGI